MSYNLINFKKIKLYIYNLIKEIIKDIIYFQILQEQNIPIALKIFTLNTKKNLKWYKIYNVFDNNIPIDPISLYNIKIKEMQFLNNRIYNKETIINILKISNKDPYTRNEINFECIYNLFCDQIIKENIKKDVIIINQQNLIFAWTETLRVRIIEDQINFLPRPFNISRNDILERLRRNRTRGTNRTTRINRTRGTNRTTWSKSKKYKYCGNY